ncbi:MAG: hypothetical protein EXQ74_05805 [Thermoleophilia bacterium]|nr:hypothetical protein [Thermoleophilia bacterium]
MNRSRTSALLVAVALLTAGGLAGCGGSEPRAATAAGETRMTVEGYVTAGNTICREAEGTVDALGTPTDIASLTVVLTTATTIGQGVVDGLSGLNPPEELADANQQLVDQMAEQIGVLTEIAAAATEGSDFVALTRELLSPDVRALAADIDATATELGLTDCR